MGTLKRGPKSLPRRTKLEMGPWKKKWGTPVISTKKNVEAN